MMVGGYFWGSLADNLGRRSVLMWSLTVNGLGGLLSSTSQVFWLFLILRFISGIGVGGSIPVIFTYFVEFQPKNKRGSMISLLATFWMGGNILAAGLAWLVIPHEGLGYFSPTFKYNSWRIFIALCTIPSLSSAAMFVLMPESPKFLLRTGKELEAIRTLQKVHHTNKHKEPFKVQALVLSDNEKDNIDSMGMSDRHEQNKHTNNSKWYQCINIKSIKQLLVSTKTLFTGSLVKPTIILLIINFTLSFGYYGLFMWFPELFNRIDKYGGTPCNPGVINTTATYNNSTSDCGTPNDWVFFEGFMTALSNLPANIFTIIMMDRLGRKTLLASSMVISGICVFFIWFVQTKVENLVMSCLFGMVSTVGWNALDVLSAEAFPTEVRSTAMGIQQALARVGAILGNIIFGELVDVHCAIPMLLVAALLAFGGLVSIRLPNTTNKDIH
ncbi:synaptic vesicle glycoprotein 2C isoform X2 [Patella vulgata]|nr:synaptic vesicle glycoprotein 2C isoform X2 [Patella vulgata]